MPESAYINNLYNCGYCDFSFKLHVRSEGGGIDAQDRGILKLTTQVQCPSCKNLLKTY